MLGKGFLFRNLRKIMAVKIESMNFTNIQTNKCT